MTENIILDEPSSKEGSPNPVGPISFFFNGMRA